MEDPSRSGRDLKNSHLQQGPCWQCRILPQIAKTAKSRFSKSHVIHVRVLKSQDSAVITVSGDPHIYNCRRYFGKECRLLYGVRRLHVSPQQPPIFIFSTKISVPTKTTFEDSTLPCHRQRFLQPTSAACPSPL